MTFLQKTDLDPNGFTNNNTAGGQGIALRVGPGSTLQAQIEQAGNGIYYYPGPLQPTHGAPNATNPQQYAQNGNGELFRFAGSWLLIGNGVILGASQPTPVNLPSGAFVAFNAVTMPRSGVVQFLPNIQIFNANGDSFEVKIDARRNGASVVELLRLALFTNTIRVHGSAAAFTTGVTAGDVFDLTAYQTGATGAGAIGGLSCNYIR